MEIGILFYGKFYPLTFEQMICNECREFSKTMAIFNMSSLTDDNINKCDDCYEKSIII